MSLFHQRAELSSYGVRSVNITIYGHLGFVLMMPVDYEDDEEAILCEYFYNYYDPHDTIMLYYDVGANIFVDDYGNIYHDIYHLLHPWQVFLFKKYKECCTFPNVTNTFLVELVYPDYMYLRHT